MGRGVSSKDIRKAVKNINKTNIKAYKVRGKNVIGYETGSTKTLKFKLTTDSSLMVESTPSAGTSSTTSPEVTSARNVTSTFIDITSDDIRTINGFNYGSFAMMYKGKLQTAAPASLFFNTESIGGIIPLGRNPVSNPRTSFTGNDRLDRQGLKSLLPVLARPSGLPGPYYTPKVKKYFRNSFDMYVLETNGQLLYTRIINVSFLSSINSSYYSRLVYIDSDVTDFWVDESNYFSFKVQLYYKKSNGELYSFGLSDDFSDFSTIRHQDLYSESNMAGEGVNVRPYKLSPVPRSPGSFIAGTNKINSSLYNGGPSPNSSGFLTGRTVDQNSTVTKIVPLSTYKFFLHENGEIVLRVDRLNDRCKYNVISSPNHANFGEVESANAVYETAFTTNNVKGIVNHYVFDKVLNESSTAKLDDLSTYKLTGNSVPNGGVSDIRAVGNQISTVLVSTKRSDGNDVISSYGYNLHSEWRSKDMGDYRFTTNNYFRISEEDSHEDTGTINPNDLTLTPTIDTRAQGYQSYPYNVRRKIGNITSGFHLLNNFYVDAVDDADARNLDRIKVLSIELDFIGGVWILLDKPDNDHDEDWLVCLEDVHTVTTNNVSKKQFRAMPIPKPKFVANRIIHINGGKAGTVSFYTHVNGHDQVGFTTITDSDYNSSVDSICVPSTTLNPSINRYRADDSDNKFNTDNGYVTTKGTIFDTSLDANKRIVDIGTFRLPLNALGVLEFSRKGPSVFNKPGATLSTATIGDSQYAHLPSLLQTDYPYAVNNRLVSASATLSKNLDLEGPLDRTATIFLTADNSVYIIGRHLERFIDKDQAVESYNVSNNKRYINYFRTLYNNSNITNVKSSSVPIKMTGGVFD